MIQVKGSAVTSRIRFVRDRYGEPAYRRLKDELAPEERAALEARILPHQWAPYDLFVRLNVRLRIHDFGRPHRAHCMSVLGWAERSAELSGADIRFSDEVACRTRGAEACELFVEWSG